jgi:hypothetical protein
MVQDDDSLDPYEKMRRIEALKGSRGRLALITPELCVSYLQAWAADRQRWQRHLERLPTGQQLPDALAMLSRRGCPPLRWRLGERVGLQAQSVPIGPHDPYMPGSEASRSPEIVGVL